MNAGQSNGNSLILTDRKRAEITGVASVDSFDEGQVTLETAQGALTVEGRELHIVRLDLERGEVVIEGKICGAVYCDVEEARRGGFFSRLVK